ncbi:MAG: ABC transporter substrate-binding protein [Holophagaceae bacterium]|nr:ABC transporter substrate-binding protein [Holophagaceae bacterium]
MRLVRIATSPVLAGILACQPASRPGVERNQAAVLAWENFPISLDPRQGQDQASQKLLSLTHQALLKRGPDLELLPDACVDWRWIQPYTELAFTFPNSPGPHTGTEFAPGRPLRAADALKSIRALMDPTLSSPKAGPFKDEIADIHIVNQGSSDQLVLRLKVSDPGFPANLVRGILGITQNGAGGAGEAGTGPYAIRELVPEQRIRLNAKPGHPDFARHAGLPLDLDIRWLPDATSRLLALRHGSVDVCLNNLPPDLLREPAGFQVHRRPGANLEYVAFNCEHPVLKDPRVRRALSLALDRPALVQGLMGGLAREAWGFFPPELPFGLDARTRPNTPADRTARLRAANDALDAAGCRRGRKGIRFSLRMHATAEINSRMKALALQAQWAGLGIDLQILTREFGTLLSEVMAGRFDVASLRWVGIADPEMLHRTFHSRMAPPAGFNRGRYADAETDRLLDSARAAGDESLRFSLLRQAQARIVDQAPYAFLWWPDQVVAARPGFELEPNAVGDFQGVWAK